MQSSCMGCLLELAEQDPQLLYLTADSGEGGLDLMFRRNFPERAFNFGISEAHMVAAAAGLAACGKIPFVYTAAPFLAYRSYEFIRIDVCLQNLPVKMIGTGSGLSVSTLGPTHHTTEDISALRALPNLTILSPATPRQAFACVRAAYETPGPVYIRLAMSREKEFFNADYSLPRGAIEPLRDGKDVSVFSTGSILEEVMAAADLLAAQGIEAAVINCPTLKPFDTARAAEQAARRPLVCSVEEHNVVGGLGSMLADAMVEHGVSAKLLKIGLEDRFSVGYGKLPALRKENGLDAATIAARIREALG